MASYSLYPPSLDSFAPGFIVKDGAGTCTIYYSLSKYSSAKITDIKSIHISVMRQSTGRSVVRKVDSGNRFRASGIIIVNEAPTAVTGSENLYRITITGDDILDNTTEGYNGIGWGVSNIYKVQIRLSTVQYTNEIGQSAFLVSQANNFSEWSTYCLTKAIGQPNVNVPLFNITLPNETNSNKNYKVYYNLTTTSLEFVGNYTPNSSDLGEGLLSYQIKLCGGGLTVEESPLKYAEGGSRMYYSFDTELIDKSRYEMFLTYTTINGYTATYSFNVEVNLSLLDEIDIQIGTLETCKEIKNSLIEEEEEGRLGLKLYSDTAGLYYGNFMIRRTDSTSNFSTWSDLMIITLDHEVTLAELPIYYDYTIESGIWYKYGVQRVVIKNEGTPAQYYKRSPLNEMADPVIRQFEFSYLLGEGGRQLKLEFDNSMNSYSYSYSDSKTDTIGGQYPFITRNGAMKYRTFPVNGLISFYMDEHNTFTSDEELYQYDNVINLYNQVDTMNATPDYNYKKEFDFREKVLEFLYDGKAKLFKSPTEGNVIIRLMNVSASPNKTLNRMIFSFSATAYEIAENTLDNYRFYNFIQTPTVKAIQILKPHIGQFNGKVYASENILNLVNSQYYEEDSFAIGINTPVSFYKGVIINFEGEPYRIDLGDNNYIMGYGFTINGKQIILNANLTNKYVFDDDFKISSSDSLFIIPSTDKEMLYDVSLNYIYYTDIAYEGTDQSNYSIIYKKRIGQICGEYGGMGNDNIILTKQMLDEKLFYNDINTLQKVQGFKILSIEGPVGARITIDYSPYLIGQTGYLNLRDMDSIENIQYAGMQDGNWVRNIPANITVTYIYETEKRIYS